MTKKITDKVLRDLILEVLTEASSVTFTVDGKYLMISGLTPEQEQDADQVKSLAISAGVPENVLKDFFSGVDDGEDSLFMLAKKHGLEDGKVYTAKKTGTEETGAGEEEETGAEETGAGEEEETGAGEEEETGDGGASKFYPFSIEKKSGETGQQAARRIKKAWKAKTGEEAPNMDTFRKWAAFDGTGSSIDQSDITHPDGRKEPDLQKLAVKQAFDLIKVLSVPGTNKRLGYEAGAVPAPSDDFSLALDSVPDNIKNAITRTFNKILGNDAVEDIAGIQESFLISEDTQKLEWEDFAAIIQNPNSDLFRPAMMALKSFKNTNPSHQITNAVSDMVKSARGTTDFSQRPEAGGIGAPSSAEVSPSIPSVDLADLQGRDRASVPAYVVNFFNGIDLNSIPSLKKRIEKINNLTEKIIGINKDAAGNITGRAGATKFTPGDASIGELISTIGVMDALSKIVKNMDNKAAGWTFESFLAQLVNGTTEGTAMGAADFVFGLGPDDPMPTGIKGSAKLISSYTFTQAQTTSMNADNAPLKNQGDTLSYIVGVKKQQSGATFATKADASLINVVDIHLIKYTRGSGRTISASDGNVVVPDKTITATGKDSYPSLEFTITPASKIGSIYLADNQQGLNDLGEEALDKIDQNIPDLLEAMSKFSRNTKSYLSGGERTSIESALNEYVSLVGLINASFGSNSEYAKETGIVTGITGDISRRQTTAVGSNNPVTEQKITANFLKKLIAESFKK